MPDYSGIIRYIVMYPLVSFSLFCSFICRHAKTVGNNPGEYFIFFHFGQLKFIQPQVHFPVQANSFCLHRLTLLFSFNKFPCRINQMCKARIRKLPADEAL